MENLKECPVCGSKEIRQGRLSDYAKIYPPSSFLKGGSNIIAIICSDCGHILSMNVAKPQKFK